MPLRQGPKGTFLHLRVTPKAGRDEVAGLAPNAAGQMALAVKVTAAPDKGAANKAVIETLAKAMRVAKSSFRLASGETSRDKVVEVMQNEDSIRHYLEELQK
ncbi:MAG: DUF167 domain-containing protein [Alphaproteobacteria bacterium]|nr:DUF167 domain-containing protein [Alphaproteobacteria bacterium]